MLERVQTLPATPGQQEEDEANRSSSYRETVFALGQETEDDDDDDDDVRTSL